MSVIGRFAGSGIGESRSSRPLPICALLVAILFTVSGLLPWLHLLVTDHRVLPGGEIVCVSCRHHVHPRPAAEPGDLLSLTPPGQDGCGCTDSCPFFGAMRSPGAGPVAVEAGVLRPERALVSPMAPPAAVEAPSFPLFLLAPKHSPPRA